MTVATFEYDHAGSQPTGATSNISIISLTHDGTEGFLPLTLPDLLEELHQAVRDLRELESRVHTLPRPTQKDLVMQMAATQRNAVSFIKSIPHRTRRCL